KRQLSQENGPISRLFTWAQLAVARRYEQRMFAGFDGVVVLSEPDKQMLNALNPRLHLHVIPNGVDTDYFDPHGQAPLTPALCRATRSVAMQAEGKGESGTQIFSVDQPILVFVGNFEYAPNVDAAGWLVQEIFPRVKKRLPEARLILVGNNPPDMM